MENLKCVVCGRKRSREDAVVLTLTEAEKASLRTAEKSAPDEIVYCRPCDRLMNDQRTALDLMKGMMVLRLRALGVNNADKIAEKFKNQLLAKSKKGSS
jgi:hypothetical protein